MRFVPVNTPLITGNEEKYLNECIRTGWISSEGEFVKKFENEFSSYIGKDHGIAVSNGSAALDIAVAALEIGKGDEVIVPAFTIISPVLSIIRAGATPVLIDSNKDTWNMDVEQIEAKITSRTKAILAVHIYGLPAEMDPIMSLCKKHNLFLIEDAAEMHGQEYNGKKCGTFGDISTFSFYPNKIITSGEGGMCLTDNTLLSERCKKLRNLCFEPDGPRFLHYELGWNYRMTNLQAAVGLAQLENIEKHIEKKRWIGRYYDNKLSMLENFKPPLINTSYAENIYWVYGLLAESEELKIKTTEFLARNKIGTRPFFWCMHEQPVFKKMGLFQNERYPVAEKLARNGFYIPSGLSLEKEDIDSVIYALLKC